MENKSSPAQAGSEFDSHWEDMSFMYSGKWPTQVFLLFCLCLILGMSVACGESGPHTPVTHKKAPEAQQVYRWASSSSPIISLDPAKVPATASLQLVGLLFTGLVQLDDQLGIRPQLAQSYDVSPDGLTYTFHLRRGLAFSDGTKLTANDVAYSIDRALSPKLTSRPDVALAYLGLIQGAQDRARGQIPTVIGSGVIVPDSGTVVITITSPAAYFLSALAYPVSYVVEQSVVDQWGDQWSEHLEENNGQGGAGPFMVKSYDATTGVVLIPNPNYYGAKPGLREIDYLPFHDASGAYSAYRAGKVDYAEVPPAMYHAAKTRKDFSQNTALTIGYLGMNYKVTPLQNTKIRQALALALDKEAMNRTVFHDAYVPTCHIIPEGMYGYNPDLSCPLGTTLKGDVARAKQLFAAGMREARVSPGTFSHITLTYPTNDPTTASLVAAMQQSWKHVLGISFATAPTSRAALLNMILQTVRKDGPLQVYLSTRQADYPDPQDWITLQFGAKQPGNGVNYGDNASQTVDQQQALQHDMEDADMINDKTARAAAYGKIEQQLVDEVATLPLYQRSAMYLLNPRVVGLNVNVCAQIPPNDWAQVYISQ